MSSLDNHLQNGAVSRAQVVNDGPLTDTGDSGSGLTAAQEHCMIMMKFGLTGRVFGAPRGKPSTYGT